MLRKLMICGLVAGLCGGLLATGFASIAGEPAIDDAIVYEDSQAAAHEHGAEESAAGHSHEAEVAPPVSRDLQKSAGLLTASVVYGLALGGIFALAFAVAYGRVAAKAGPRATAYWMAAAAFAVICLVPFVKYPANPPAGTLDDTVGERTALYFTMIAISVLAAVAAARLRVAVAPRWGGHNANLAAILSFLVIVVVAGLALPAVSETPADFPATTLWSFRVASLGTQALLWLTIGLVFAPLAQRAMTGQPLLGRPQARETVAATAPR
jgi:predicted cobalt transporter CbtA